MLIKKEPTKVREPARVLGFQVSVLQVEIGGCRRIPFGSLDPALRQQYFRTIRMRSHDRPEHQLRTAHIAERQLRGNLRQLLLRAGAWSGKGRPRARGGKCDVKNHRFHWVGSSATVST